MVYYSSVVDLMIESSDYYTHVAETVVDFEFDFDCNPGYCYCTLDFLHMNSTGKNLIWLVTGFRFSPGWHLALALGSG